MSGRERLANAAVILACVGIGVKILWSNVTWIGWIAVALAIGLALRWIILELNRPEWVPSFVFVFGAPLGDNNSPVWVMLLKHYGPGPAHNCAVGFSDDDRKNIEHQWLVQHPNSPFPPRGLAGKSQERLSVSEADPDGSIGNFRWMPLDPDRQHYTVSITCRDGVFVEKWEVTRVDGVLRTRITIEHGPQWAKRNPKSDPVVFSCTDPEFSAMPLASTVPMAQKKPTHRGWKPNHRFEFPVAIIDPNGNVQVASGVKLPDGTEKTDFGCWNILTRHFGDATVPRRAKLSRLWAAVNGRSPSSAEF